MPDRKRVVKGLEALRDAMSEHQCYVCSHEFIDVADEFGTNIIDDAIALLEEQDAVGPILRREGLNKYYYACSWCGNKLVYGQNLCSECGKAVKWEG